MMEDVVDGIKWQVMTNKQLGVWPETRDAPHVQRETRRNHKSGKLTVGNADPTSSLVNRHNSGTVKLIYGLRIIGVGHSQVVPQEYRVC